LGSYDLYWIAVDRSTQGQGLGRLLMEEVKNRVRAAGGRRIYIETSTRPPYTPTRAFYDRCGCRLEVVLQDFYASGDGKAIYVLVV
jgi:ribosomal protein S18 acetylase RimI-like enzyme